MSRYKFIAIPFLLYVAYLHFYLFYGQFNVNIKYWIGIDEFFVLFFDDLAAYSWDMIIIVGGGYTLLYMQKEFKYNPRHFKYNARKRMWWEIAQILSLMLVAALISLSIVYLFPHDDYEKVIDALQAFVVMVVLSAVIWFRENLERHFKTTFLTSDILLFLVAITITVNSLTSAAKKEKQVLTSTNYAKVTLKTQETQDSLIYLGGTNKYHFLFSNINKNAFVFERNTVQSIKIKFKDRMFSIYN